MARTFILAPSQAPIHTVRRASFLPAVICEVVQYRKYNESLVLCAFETLVKLLGRPCSAETSPNILRLGLQSVFTSLVVLLFSVRYYISLVNDEISGLRHCLHDG